MQKHAFWRVLAALVSISGGTALLDPPRAAACGGFFCGRQPVDQTAERILFKVSANSVTMVTQIAYNGDAPDFAWVLPLAAVPDKSSLGLFPQRALTALDANTGPIFIDPDACLRRANTGVFAPSANAAADAGSSSGVTVHYRTEVGPYDVATIESPDAMALYDWLIDNQFSVKESMLPYIRAYTEEGMKFLALKLKRDATASDIQPFRFDLPGTSPSIPLRMTAIAAEPEMGILVFVFADGRYNGANWPDVTISDDQIIRIANTYPPRTNWAALVARGIDAAGGHGWVTELAQSTQQLKALLSNSSFATKDDQDAAAALMSLIGDSPYISRLYARLSAEEMSLDPIFHRTTLGDVSNQHKLAAVVDGIDQCPDKPLPVDPCLLTSCGAGGVCRPVKVSGQTDPVAGCGCLDGASARTTFDPSGTSLQATTTAAPAAIVACQDSRMSFVNPGDVIGGQAMPDPCLSFDCGAHGSCVSVNLTPTCACDHGFVAVGHFASDGTRTTSCVQPMVAVPNAFYQQRLPDLSAALPGGRDVKVDAALPVVQPSMNDLGSNSAALPTGSASTKAPNTNSACNASHADVQGAVALALWLGLCGLALRTRARVGRRS